MTVAGNQPFQIYNVTMTGSWVEWEIPNQVNSVLVQARSTAQVEISTDISGAPKFTLKASYAVMLGSFNTNNQKLYFKGANGVVVEIVTANKP